LRPGSIAQADVGLRMAGGIRTRFVTHLDSEGMGDILLSGCFGVKGLRFGIFTIRRTVIAAWSTTTAPARDRSTLWCKYGNSYGNGGELTCNTKKAPTLSSRPFSTGEGTLSPSSVPRGISTIVDSLSRWDMSFVLSAAYSHSPKSPSILSPERGTTGSEQTWRPAGALAFATHLFAECSEFTTL
jgi:hypothetical protein